MGCCIKRIISLTEAITADSVINVIDGDGGDITTECMFSWSCDGVCYTDFISYDEYSQQTPYLDTDYYLKILFCGSFDRLLINCEVTTDYSISIQEHDFSNFDFCSDPNLFDPYSDLDCALQLQQQLSDMVVCMFGIPIYYFRVDPDLDSKDITFKEFTIHNVVDCKQIKLMLEDGQLPSSNYRITEFDFDWESDWETELSKTQFASAFGDTAYPKYGDFLYVPLMNRMWNVNSAYDEKQDGLMWHSTTWKLYLVKYEDFKNIDKGDFESMVDNLLNKTYNNTFTPEEKNEQFRQTGVLQTTAPKYAATNLYDIFHEDAIRKQFTKDDIDIKQEIICNHNTIVARNVYNFFNENGTVIYQDGICGSSGTISVIIETPDMLFKSNTSRTILEFGNIAFNLSYDGYVNYLECGSLKLAIEPKSRYIIVYKYDKSNLMRRFVSYKQNPTHKDIPIWKLRQHPQMFCFDFDSPTQSLSDTYYEDDEMNGLYQCSISGYPLKMTNIKYYNVCLNDDQLIPELCKYTTTHDSIIINDVARPISSGRGYAVK